MKSFLSNILFCILVLGTATPEGLAITPAQIAKFNVGKKDQSGNIQVNSVGEELRSHASKQLTSTVKLRKWYAGCAIIGSLMVANLLEAPITAKGFFQNLFTFPTVIENPFVSLEAVLTGSVDSEWFSLNVPGSSRLLLFASAYAVGSGAVMQAKPWLHSTN